MEYSFNELCEIIGITDPANLQEQAEIEDWENEGCLEIEIKEEK